MNDLAEIAASVAKALWLEDGPRGFGPEELLPKYEWWDGAEFLSCSGHNLFASYWQVRCRDWLHAQGFRVCTSEVGGNLLRKVGAGDWHNTWGSPASLHPMSEFCARAIHALMKDKP